MGNGGFLPLLIKVSLFWSHTPTPRAACLYYVGYYVGGFREPQSLLVASPQTS